MARCRLVALCRSLLPAWGPNRGRPAHDDGATIVEFAVVAPTMMIMLMVIFDMAQMAYAHSMLNGAVQDAARNSSLESRNTAVADRYVTEQMERVLPGTTVVTSRLRYYDFADIGAMEHWQDTNLNGTCNVGETYTDMNNNGIWDRIEPGSGNGGASDVIYYTVNVDYTPIFKIPFAPATWNARRLTSVAVRKNQPFGDQEDFYSSTVRSCI